MRRKSILASYLVLVVLALAAAMPMYADNNEDPPITVGRLSGLAGTVSVQPSGVNQWSTADYNYPLTTGDRLYADQDGRAEVELGQTVARVWHDTDLTVTNLTDQITQLGLSQGTLRVRTFGLDPDQTVEVDTPNGAITVTQPGSFRVDVYPGDEGTQITVNSGALQITGPNLSQNIGAGESIRLTGTNPIQVASLGMPGSDEFDDWSQQRDEQILRNQAPQYVNPSTIGSEDLDQYGTWSNAPQYGPIWYPNDVATGWVPYSTGHWVWVAPWGWTWVDAEPWGFAPFHYGRWVSWGGRWGWIPGPYAVAPVYSPALVGWVGGAGFGVGFGFSGGVSAWFPLGPGEPFFPWYHCSPGYFGRVNITNIHIATINRATNIRNVNATNYYSYYHQKDVVDNMHFANRTVATTAMRQTAFASGQRVTPQTAIHPTATQLQSAKWIPHPMVNPTVHSVVPHPVSHVPVSTERSTLLTPYGEQRAVAGARTEAVPYHPQPQRAYDNHPTPTAPQQNRAYQQPQTQSRPLVIRNETPAGEPSFQQRQPAMNHDPGRPLDPWQVNNIRRGQPAGLPHTQEVPPHPAMSSRSNGGSTSHQEVPRQEAPRQNNSGGHSHR